MSTFLIHVLQKNVLIQSLIRERLRLEEEKEAELKRQKEEEEKKREEENRRRAEEVMIKFIIFKFLKYFHLLSFFQTLKERLAQERKEEAKRKKEELILKQKKEGSFLTKKQKQESEKARRLFESQGIDCLNNYSYEYYSAIQRIT